MSLKSVLKNALNATAGSPVTNAVGQALGGANATGTATTATTTNFPYYGLQQSFSTTMHTGPSSWSVGGGLYSATKRIHHEVKSADAYKSLTAYIRAILRCEEHCECKWCGASELERQMAIAQFFVPEKEEP